MQYARIAAFLLAAVAAAWPAPPAWAQYGLSGSPELMALSPGFPGSEQPAYPSTSAPSVVAADPAMRPISPAIPPAVNTGYYGFPAQTAAQPSAVPVNPPLSAPNTMAPTLPPLGSAGPGAGLTGQMLADPAGSCWAGYGNPSCTAAPSCAAPSCAAPSCDLGPCLYQPVWYAGAAGLIMSRNNANRVWTTYHNGHNAEQMLQTQEAMPGWQGGFEITLGRTFACNCWAVEVSYWWLGQMDGFAEVPNRDYTSDAEGFSYGTPFSFDNVVWANPGISGTPHDIFGFARQHRIWRSDSFQNLELNLIRHQIQPDSGNGLALDWSLGARYFRFDEELKVGALRQNVTGEPTYHWGDSGGIYEAYLDDTIHNSLIGFQFGLSAVYPIHPSLRFFLSPKFGIYNNHIQHRFSGYRGDGEVFAPNAISEVPGSFPVSASTDSLAFLTEINLGLDWNFARNWTAFLGYRVIWATGIGLAENQYIPYVVDIPGHQQIETNGELVLHGAFAGLTFCF